MEGLVKLTLLPRDVCGHLTGRHGERKEAAGKLAARATLGRV